VEELCWGEKAEIISPSNLTWPHQSPILRVDRELAPRAIGWLRISGAICFWRVAWISRPLPSLSKARHFDRLRAGSGNRQNYLPIIFPMQ
jgi:hypothetical protein